MKKINSIHTTDNYRFNVGGYFDGVFISHILPDEESCGTYLIRWYMVWSHGELLAKVNALSTTFITYKTVGDNEIFPPRPTC